MQLEREALTAARRSYSWHEAATKTLRVYERVTGVRLESLDDPPQSRPR